MKNLLSASDIGAVLELARLASGDIMEIYAGSEREVSFKLDQSPITAADLASNRRLAGGLPSIGNGWPVLSEEDSAAHDFAVRRQWRTYWCVDPLDGTKGFVKGNGEFAINIGLVHEGKAHWGMVYSPTQDHGWYGGVGYGAFFHDTRANTTNPIQAQRPANKPLRALISRNHVTPFEIRLLEIINETEWGPVEGHRGGSSMKYCKIAQGDVDLMPRFNPCMEWDTAAPQAILEAVGGSVLDHRGNPLVYNGRDSLQWDELLAIADLTLPWRDWFAAVEAAR